MNKVRYRLMHISRCKGIGRKTIRKFLQFDPTLEEIYNLSVKDLNLQFSIPLKKAHLFYSTLHDSQQKNQLIHDLKKYKIITIVDEVYPTMLRTIRDAPLVLYALGDLRLLQTKPALAVIGTRKPSYEAKAKLDYITKPLLEENWLIVSGMAKGIDGYAHMLALEQAGKTIAVLGGGFEYIYPKEHIPLFKEIVEYGLVISEYPPKIKPAKHHFPERNRIISGLAFGTLVIEATEKSGTMITVEQALDQGRDVFAVPGSPIIPQTRGCHLLIQDGAKLTQHANDIREDWITRTNGYIKNNDTEIKK